MASNPDWEQRGARLKELRTGLGLYQKQFAEQLLAAGVAMADGKLDQPTVSEMERGKVEIPESVFSAIEGGLVTAAPPSQPPPPGAGGGQRRGRGRSARPAAAPARPAAAPAASEVEPDDDDELEVGDGDDELGVEADDVLPNRPPDTAPRAPQARPVVVSDERAITALEQELLKVFKGATFLIPIDVGNGVEYTEGTVPGLAQLLGAVNPADGRVIEMHAESMAAAWAELARQNATVRRFLLALTYGGAWRGVLLATAPVIYSIAVNHGMIPNMLGAGPQPQQAAPAAEQVYPMTHVPVNPDPPATVTVPLEPMNVNGAADTSAMQAQLAAMQAELDRREREQT